MALKENVPVTDIGIPGIGLGGAGFDPSKVYDNYSVKYKKFNMDEPADIIELQNIETNGLRGQDIVVLKKDSYAFMDKFFIVIQYLEKNE